MAPLIRSTLIALYLALVLPLPMLAPEGLRPLMLVAVPLGLVLILALVSEQVELDGGGIRVGHPRWCGWLLRRGWQLRWDQLSGLTPVATSQGGRVFYLRSREGGAYLLPQRVARFEAFLAQLTSLSGLNLSAVGRISPPWTYQLLALLCWLFLATELAWLGWRLIRPA
ncbi:MAG: hypothetical protein ACKO7Z_11550 [Cyanobacteriota bacterium]